MEDKIRVLLTEEEVNEKIKKIGEQVLSLIHISEPTRH